MNTKTPTAKVGWMTATAAAVTVAFWLLNTYRLIPSGLPPVPAEIQGSVTTVIIGLVGYFIPDRRSKVAP